MRNVEDKEEIQLIGNVIKMKDSKKICIVYSILPFVLLSIQMANLLYLCLSGINIFTPIVNFFPLAILQIGKLRNKYINKIASTEWNLYNFMNNNINNDVEDFEKTSIFMSEIFKPDEIKITNLKMTEYIDLEAKIPIRKVTKGQYILIKSGIYTKIYRVYKPNNQENQIVEELISEEDFNLYLEDLYNNKVRKKGIDSAKKLVLVPNKKNNKEEDK